MLLFGIVILALGAYQSAVVPQQNADVELSHDAQLNTEFPKIQAAMSNAASSNSPRTATVTLGTQYPARALSNNPPAVSGTLSTGTTGSLSVTGTDDELWERCGLSGAPETRSIQYQGSYNEIQNTGRFVYENGVTYRMADDGVNVKTDQELVDGSTVRLAPLSAGELSRSSTSSEQLRFHPGETATFDVDTEGDSLALSFPSELTAETWETLLADETRLEGVQKTDDVVTVTLAPGTYTVECTPVGLGTTPEQGPVDDGGERTNATAAANHINPNAPGAVVLTETSDVRAVGQETVTVTMWNRTNADSTVEIVGGRLNFYATGGPGESAGTKPDEVTIHGNTLSVGGTFESFDQPKPLTPDETTVELTFEWDRGGSDGVRPDHVYVLTLEFSNGDVNTYFVSHE